MQQGLDEGLSDLSGLFASTASGVRDKAQGYSQECIAGLKAAQEQATATIQALLAGIQVQSAQLAAFGTRQEACAQASLSALHQLSSSAQQQLLGEKWTDHSKRTNLG